MIGSRAVQGLGAALMLPAALSIVMNMFAEGAERNKALGIWGGIGAGGATVGLIAGGVLTRYAGWQYIFYLNVPIGATAMAAGPAGRPREPAVDRSGGGSTSPGRSRHRRASCCWSTRSRRRHSTAGAPLGRWRCSRHPPRFSSPSS